MREKPEKCEGCNYETEELELYGDQKLNEKRVWLCDLCSETKCGSAAVNRVYPTTLHMILQTVVYVGNKIIDEIKKEKQ